MILKKPIYKEDGYTIVEILVALVLLSILVVFTTNIFSLITSKEFADTKLVAIEQAKKEMHKTLELKKYTNFTTDSDFNLILNQNVKTEKSLIFITISVINQKTNQTIYELKSIRPVEEK